MKRSKVKVTSHKNIEGVGLCTLWVLADSIIWCYFLTFECLNFTIAENSKGILLLFILTSQCITDDADDTVDEQANKTRIDGGELDAGIKTHAAIVDWRLTNDDLLSR